MSVSTCLDGEYGFSDVSIGVPVVLGKSGVEKIFELELSNQAKDRFDKSVAVVKEAIAALKS
jgi:malate dehydrogenase